jgi:hypothetical protein
MVGTVIIPASDFVKLLQSQTRQQGSQKPISADSSSRTQINSNSRVAKDDRDTSKGKYNSVCVVRCWDIFKLTLTWPFPGLGACHKESYLSEVRKLY